MDDKPKRRWFSYSLRTLLVFVTIASVGFGWLGMKMRQAERQRQAIEVIQALGGAVFYDYERDFNEIFNPSPTPPGPEWIRDFLGDNFFAEVTAVNLSRMNVGDDVMVQLQELPKLQRIHLWGTKITDAGLIYLERLSELQTLDVSDTKVTEAGCQELQKALPNLEIIR